MNYIFLVAANADELLALPTENSTHVNRCKADTSQQEVYLPNANWQNEQINHFTNVRLKIARHFALSKKEPPQEENSKIKTPKPKDEYGWCTFCFGNDFWNQIIEALKAKDEYDEESDQKLKKKSYANAAAGEVGYQPLLKILSNLRPTVVSQLIEYHSSWAESIEKVTLDQALWFYGLLSIVEKPLHPDDQSCLRSFVIVCSKQRRAIIESSSSEKNSAEVEKSISHLNLIICLVAKYFGQADLADESSNE